VISAFYLEFFTYQTVDVEGKRLCKPVKKNKCGYTIWASTKTKEGSLQKPEQSLQQKVVIFQQLSGFAL